MSERPQASRIRADVERAGRAAAVLSALEREILVLNALMHMPIPDIAARLAMDERRIERVLARAVLKFDRELHRQQGHPDGLQLPDRQTK